MTADTVGDILSDKACVPDAEKWVRGRSIPIHSRHEAVSGRPRDTKGTIYFLSVSCPFGREK